MGKAASKKMLINVKHPEEARVAIVRDGRLMELNIEISGKEQTKGNIYKGVVMRVEPGLQAAFVDIGRSKLGFLQMGELHPNFWQWRDDIPEDQRKRRPRIQEVLHRGQEIIVQVEKDERDTKGAALTTYLSLPGRYMVLMPGSDSAGVSRKVERESDRKALKEIMVGMNIPEGMGYIVRTQALGRSPEELQKDMDNLLALYEGIKKSAGEISGAGEIYRDRGLITRFIRDYFSDDIDEVVVDSKEAANEAKEFFRETMPGCEKLVKLHREKRPIFSRFQIEEQIDQIYEKRVPLPSGGSLIIEPTEALVSIDVNSGKTSGERGIEDTAFRANMEAAEEVARQLRLRDLGGLIVIDFIDMRDRKHNHEVEKTLKQALKADKARVNLGRISEFGLFEMSRQRIAKTLNAAIHLECPHCEGRGKVRSVEAMALSFLRKIHGAAAKGNVAEVHGGLPLEVAYHLLNRKKRELVQIENDYGIVVNVKGKTSFLMNQLDLTVIKREKSRTEETDSVEREVEANNQSAVFPEAATLSVDKEQGQETTGAEMTKKRKRRRKKKKPPIDATPAQSVESQEAEQKTLEHTDTAIPKSLEAPETETERDTAEPAPKKRRRHRSKKTQKTSKSTDETVAKELQSEVSDSSTPETALSDEKASNVPSLQLELSDAAAKISERVTDEARDSLVESGSSVPPPSPATTKPKRPSSPRGTKTTVNRAKADAKEISAQQVPQSSEDKSVAPKSRRRAATAKKAATATSQREEAEIGNK